MGSPYGIYVEWTLEDSGEKVAHDMEGPDFVPREGAHVYFNDVGYKVESNTLYVYDKTTINPITQEEAWSIVKVLYRVKLSLL